MAEQGTKGRTHCEVLWWMTRVSSEMAVVFGEGEMGKVRLTAQLRYCYLDTRLCFRRGCWPECCLVRGSFQPSELQVWRRTPA